MINREPLRSNYSITGYGNDAVICTKLYERALPWKSFSASEIETL